MRYRIFTNDVGPRRTGYSCLTSLAAASDVEALNRAEAMVRRCAPVKVLAIREDLVDVSFRRGPGASSGGLKPLAGVFKRSGRSIER